MLCGLKLEEDIFGKSAAADISFNAHLLLFFYVMWSENMISTWFLLTLYLKLKIQISINPGIYKYGKGKIFGQHREIHV